jgi:hypothetical protein
MSSAEALTKHVGNALAYGLTGRHQEAWTEIKTAVAPDPLAMYATISALAEVAVADHADRGSGGVFGLTVQHQGREADINGAPAAQRLAMQFMAAQANRDLDMTRALFTAAMNTDPASVADATLIVYEAALKTSRERINRRKEVPGADA